MKLYIAAPWARRKDAAYSAQVAVALGHTITHDWWNRECGDEDTAELARLADLDFSGVIDADVFIVLNVEKSEGKAVEQGIALNQRRFNVQRRPRLIGVGPRGTNIFQYMPQWEWVETFNDALALLK